MPSWGIPYLHVSLAILLKKDADQGVLVTSFRTAKASTISNSPNWKRQKLQQPLPRDLALALGDLPCKQDPLDSPTRAVRG